MAEVVLNPTPEGSYLFYHQRRHKGSHMEVCPVCNHPIQATVLEERKHKSITVAAAEPDAPAGVGRFLTIRSLICACGERIERLYENRPLSLVGQSSRV